MVRVSGALDLGVEVERGERRRLPPTNQGRGRNRADASRTIGNGTRINNNTFNPTTLNNRSDGVISGRIPASDFARGVQHNPTIEHGNGAGRTNRRFPVKLTTQVQNQQRLRPKLLSTIPTIIKQESIEMEPLLSGSILPSPSTLSTSLRNDNNRIRANTSAQVMHHRNPIPKHQESKIATPHQYNNDFMHDDEDDDIVCCEDSFRHEGTKNICTIFIWAALVFFIMNRFFLHMSMYLHRGEETKEVFVVRDNNFTLSG